MTAIEALLLPGLASTSVTLTNLAVAVRLYGPLVLGAFQAMTVVAVPPAGTNSVVDGPVDPPLAASATLTCAPVLPLLPTVIEMLELLFGVTLSGAAMPANRGS